MQQFYADIDIQFVLPVRTEILSLFISHLDYKEFAPSSIATHLSAVSYIHKLNDWADPCATFLIKKLLSACFKKKPVCDTRLPITKTILSKIVSALNYTVDNKYLMKLFKAMFSLAFHAFLRVGEITVKSKGVKNLHNLSLSQIEISLDLKITFLTFKHSKGQPVVLTIKRQSYKEFCPVFLLQDYLMQRGLSEGPLFLTFSGSAVTRHHFMSVLKSALEFCKLSSDKFKGHSFRIGAATEASLQGKSDNQIRQLGRWSSDALFGIFVLLKKLQICKLFIQWLLN